MQNQDWKLSSNCRAENAEAGVLLATLCKEESKSILDYELGERKLQSGDLDSRISISVWSVQILNLTVSIMTLF